MKKLTRTHNKWKAKKREIKWCLSEIEITRKVSCSGRTGPKPRAQLEIFSPMKAYRVWPPNQLNPHFLRHLLLRGRWDLPNPPLFTAPVADATMPIKTMLVCLTAPRRSRGKCSQVEQRRASHGLLLMQVAEEDGSRCCRHLHFQNHT